MDKKKFEELIQLYFFDELTEKEKVELEKYLRNDEEAQEEFESLRQLHSALAESKPHNIDDKELYQEREKLFRVLKNTETKISFAEKIKDWFAGVFMFNYQAALGGIAVLVIGVLIGYYAATSNEKIELTGFSLDNYNPTELEEKGMTISNIRFTDPFNNEGQIEFIFDAVKPLKYQGSMQDKTVQHLLAKALLKEQELAAVT